MTPRALVFLALSFSPAALAQPIVATPLPPLDGQAEPPRETPAPKPAAPPWLPRDVATVQALDKVNAQSTILTVKVGETARFGSLTILVKGCVVRPPDRSADAAAFLEVADSRDPSAGFAGWLVRSAPAVSMLQHPIFDLRVAGCGG